MSLESISVNKPELGKYALISVLLVLLAVMAINILLLSDFSMPLGTDGLIKYWPVGESLHKSVDVVDFLTILTSGFMGEDKFSPVSKLLGYALYAPDRNPVTSFKRLLVLTFC